MSTSPPIIVGVPASGGTFTGGVTVSSGGLNVTGALTEHGNIDVATAGSGLMVKEGTNCKQGSATLVAGTVAVSNTNVTASSRILTGQTTPGGTPGALFVPSVTVGSGFTITSTSSTDTSTVAYEIFEPG